MPSDPEPEGQADDRREGQADEGQADGRLAMVRPRNFKLELSSDGPDQGQHRLERRGILVLGAERRRPSIYWCNYDDLESSALAVTYQPDWIIEALGLKPITPEEAAAIKVRETDDPNASALVFPPTRNRGEILSADDDRLELHPAHQGTPHLRGQPPETLAGPGDRSRLQGLRPREIGIGRLPELLPAREPEARVEERPVDAGCRCSKDVVVNQFDSSRAAAIFVEPVIPGYERVNLAEMARADRETTARPSGERFRRPARETG